MTKSNTAVYVVAAKRTPVVKAGTVFRHVRPDDLLAHAIQAVLAETPSLDPAAIDDVIAGCAMPEAEQGMNVARIAALLAGLPDTVPGMTVNRFCCSGIQTVSLAADRIATGEADIILAGGTESMSMVPMGGNRFVANPAYFAGDGSHEAIALGMGITAEKVATQWAISREDQDAFAYDSHQRALAAIAGHAFDSQIRPYTVNESIPNLAAGTVMARVTEVDVDNGPRKDTSLERLAMLRPVFAANGSVTAGNSSQMSDGAGALLLASEKALSTHNLTPIARFCGYAVKGVAPEIMGIGPTLAIPAVCQQTGIALDDIDWIELNEAFAAQALAVIRDCKLDPQKVNPHGGAIALGHPLGATGAIKSAMLLHGMRQRQQRYGMVTMCIGTGMGAAGIYENLV